MKDLFDPALIEETKRRVLLLESGSERQWGTMSVAQALAHCTRGMQMAMGGIQPKRVGFPVNVLGRVIKPMVLREDEPMRRNSPSVAELFPERPAECEFERERMQLMATIDSFAARGAAGCSGHPHPFFWGA